PARTFNDVPGSIRFSPDGNVGLAIAVVICRNGTVVIRCSCSAPDQALQLIVRASANTPEAVRFLPDVDVCLAITIVIAWHGHITILPEIIDTNYAIAAPDDVPVAVHP